MALIFFESVGFSATTSLSIMIRESGKNWVSHGSQNFKEPVGLGKNNLPLPKFIDQMNELSADYANCVAVHSLFSLGDIRNFAQNSDIKLYGIARRSQKNQILSCFYWVVNKFLQGDEITTGIFSKFLEQHRPVLKQIGLPANFVTCFLLYSVERVISYNFVMTQTAEKIFLTEDIIADPKSSLMKFGLDDVTDENVVLVSSNSHKSKIRDLPYFEGVEAVLDQMMDIVQLTIRGKAIKAGHVEDALLERAS